MTIKINRMKVVERATNLMTQGVDMGIDPNEVGAGCIRISQMANVIINELEEEGQTLEDAIFNAAMEIDSMRISGEL